MSFISVFSSFSNDSLHLLLDVMVLLTCSLSHLRSLLMFIVTSLFSIIPRRRWYACALTLIIPQPSISPSTFPWKPVQPPSINFPRLLLRVVPDGRCRRATPCPAIRRDVTLCKRYSIMLRPFNSNTNKSSKHRKDPRASFLGNRWANCSKRSNRHERNRTNSRRAMIKRRRGHPFSSEEKLFDGLLYLDTTIISTKMNFSIRHNDDSLLFHWTTDVLFSFFTCEYLSSRTTGLLL